MLMFIYLDPSCCRPRATQSANECNGYYSKNDCEQKGCIWGWLSTHSVNAELNLGVPYLHQVVIGHYSWLDMFNKNAYMTGTAGIFYQTKSNSIFMKEKTSSGPGEEWFAYDKCGNYVTVNVQTDQFQFGQANARRFNHLNLVKYAQTSPAIGSKGYTDTKDYVYGKVYYGAAGSATLISTDTLVTCTHNVASKVKEEIVNSGKMKADPNDPMKYYVFAGLQR